MPSPIAPKEPVDFTGPTLPRASSGVRTGGADTLFKAGDRVAENLQLVRLLGVGGMGDVWLANHMGLDTAVAVKFMSSTLAHDAPLIERFAREAKLSSQIKSPHVVQIFDFATTHEGIPYIVMELIEGETLEARIRRDGKLGLEETSRILIQLCRALTKAHEIGIIHRDMKPENVLLGEEEGALFVRVLDFGIAKHIDSPSGVTDAGATMGTPSYMSPEQLFRTGEMDHRSDLWALGVMTYFCVTGSLPFQGDSFGAVCIAINGGIYPAASKLNAGVPQAMDAWFAKALAPSPDERFASAKDMSDAYLGVLEVVGQLPPWAVRKEAVEGEAPSYAGGTGSVPANPIPLRPKGGRRRRVALAVVGAVMLLAIGFWSRDATLGGQFVKAHLPAGWASHVDQLRADRASVPESESSRVASPAVASSSAPPVASAPPARLALARTPPKAAPMAPPATAQAISVEGARSPTTDRPAGERLSGETAASESEGNPYVESGTPPAGLAPEPPAKVVIEPQSSPGTHAPAL